MLSYPFPPPPVHTWRVFSSLPIPLSDPPLQLPASFTPPAQLNLLPLRLPPRRFSDILFGANGFAFLRLFAPVLKAALLNDGLCPKRLTSRPFSDYIPTSLLTFLFFVPTRPASRIVDRFYTVMSPFSLAIFFDNIRRLPLLVPIRFFHLKCSLGDVLFPPHSLLPHFPPFPLNSFWLSLSPYNLLFFLFSL